MFYDVNEFMEYNDLASNFSVYLVVKGFNRLEVKDRIARRKAGLPELTNSKIPPKGAVLKINLKNDFISDSIVDETKILRCVNPYEYFSLNYCTYFTTADTVFFQKGDKNLEVTDDLLCRIHSIDRNHETGDFIIAASGYDLIFTIDNNLDIKECWSVWANCAHINKSIHDFVLDLKKQGTTIDSNDLHYQIEKIKRQNGYSVTSSPFYITGAKYGHTSEILFTGYNCTSLYVKKGNNAEKIEKNYVKPHCFEPIFNSEDAYYSVADSGRGELVKLDRHFNELHRYSIINLDRRCCPEKDGEWVQYVRYLDKNYNICVMVDAIRCCLQLIDISKKQRRTIPYPHTWSVHGISTVQ